MRRRITRPALGHLLTAALILGGTVAGPSSAEAAEGDPKTWVTAVSEPGDPVGEGRSYIWRPGSGEVVTSRDAAGNFVVEAGGGTSPDAFRFVFAAPAGESITTGSYPDAHDLASRNPGQPGLDITAGGRRCASSAGKFSLQALDPDLNKARFHYESRCGAGQPALFGEITINMGSAERVTVIPFGVMWPDTDLHTAARQVPVTIVNNSTQPLSVESAYVQSSGGFSVENTCADAQPGGGTCTVMVGFQPFAPGRQSGAVNFGFSEGFTGGGIAVGGAGRVPPILGVPPYPVQYAHAEAYRDSALLTWQNPLSADFAETVVRYAPGPTPPATVNDGFHAYVGREQETWVEGLRPGTIYSFSFFARDSEGLVAAPGTTSLNGTITSLTVDRSRVTWGGPVELRGVVRDLGTGHTVANAEVVLGGETPDGRYIGLGSVHADFNGRFALRFTPAEIAQYVAVHPGDGSRLGSYSAPTKVTVATLVLFDSTARRLARGQTVKFIASAGPVDRSAPIELQKQAGKKWRTVARKRPNKDGTAVFTVKPSTRGEAKYRAVRPGAAGAAKGHSRTIKLRVT